MPTCRAVVTFLTPQVTVSALLAPLFLASSGVAAGVEVQPKSCGRYAIAIAADFLGYRAPEGYWERRLPGERAPFSLSELEAAATEAGLVTLPVQWTDPAAADLSLPCVLHVKATETSDRPDHFVTCFGSDGSFVCLGDYPGMPLMVPREHLMRYWSGTALYVATPGNEGLNRLRWKLRLASVRKGALLVSAAVFVSAIGFPLVRFLVRRTGNSGTTNSGEAPPCELSSP